ncbi:MAG TPA: hypothetical protein VHE81_07445 [Lacipirellulaceae bacterium]|nr:hypothetical protein [Lacipirellulaceae bacterium]
MRRNSQAASTHLIATTFRELIPGDQSRRLVVRLVESPRRVGRLWREHHPKVAFQANDGLWTCLFKPAANKLQSAKLVNLHDHEYKLEPNAHVAPDGRSIIFRSNMHGVPQIYAVMLQ